MKITKIQDSFIIEITPDEYNRLCDFMYKNGVGYGPGRTLTSEFRQAKEIYEKEKS